MPVTRDYKKFAGNGAKMTQWRVWVVLHMLLDYYIFGTSGSELDVHDINACTLLNGKDKSQNARNYVLYVASKSRLKSKS